jgi:hypothetical protein
VQHGTHFTFWHSSCGTPLCDAVIINQTHRQLFELQHQLPTLFQKAVASNHDEPLHGALMLLGMILFQDTMLPPFGSITASGGFLTSKAFISRLLSLSNSKVVIMLNINYCFLSLHHVLPALKAFDSNRAQSKGISDPQSPHSTSTPHGV